MSTSRHSPGPSGPPWQPRFGLALMLLVMFACSVTGAAGFYLVQALQRGGTARLAFILFTVASPLLLLVAVSLVWTAFDRFFRR